MERTGKPHFTDLHSARRLSAPPSLGLASWQPASSPLHTQPAVDHWHPLPASRLSGVGYMRVRATRCAAHQMPLLSADTGCGGRVCNTAAAQRTEGSVQAMAARAQMSRGRTGRENRADGGRASVAAERGRGSTEQKEEEGARGQRRRSRARTIAHYLRLRPGEPSWMVASSAPRACEAGSRGAPAHAPNEGAVRSGVRAQAQGR